MPLAPILAKFRADVAQCDSLIGNVHQLGADGNPILPVIDRQQITVAAFLNMFIAWETFLEASLSVLMTGAATISGTAPQRFVMPPNEAEAKKLVIGTSRYFDYGNHHYVNKMVPLYFNAGYPYQPVLNGIFNELEDLRVMRNASAHISSTTQTALESLALRITGSPQPGIVLYTLLTMSHPGTTPPTTVFATYRGKLILAAELIAQG